jgi:hypothetical protein
MGVEVSDGMSNGFAAKRLQIFSISAAFILRSFKSSKIWLALALTLSPREREQRGARL